MLKKTSHFVVVVLVIVGIFAVYHMVVQHSGQGILPAGMGGNLGTK